MLKILLSPLSSLKRVGPAIEETLVRLVGKNKIFNLLLHFPLKSEKILLASQLSDIENNSLVIIKAKVEIHTKPTTSRQPYKILCRTPSGYITLIFFKIFPSQIEKLAIGRELAILGHLQRSLGENQITHPQEILDVALIDTLPKTNIIYPMTYALTPKFLRQKIEEALQILKKEYSPEQEWIDKKLLQSQNWPSFADALEMMHDYKKEKNLLPNSVTKFSPAENFQEQKGLVYDSCEEDFQEQREQVQNINHAKKRLAYDEMLAWQLALLLVKEAEVVTKKMPKITRNFADEFLAAMPFKPTNAQLRAASEIKNNVLSNKKMLRLLQGDVGSGKTVLAIYACLLAFSQGKQSCIIVPITILAEQHFSYFQKMLQNLDFSSLKADSSLQNTQQNSSSKLTSAQNNSRKPVIELLLGKQTKKQKAKILQELREGKIDILISTHAVLQDDVIFQNLALVVIDEQHRFGVMQRLKLVEKGPEVDVLLMSATPIPRSLMMAIYGDMDISILGEKPAGRKEIETLVMSENKKSEVFVAIKRALVKQEKIYWICPAIEENEEVELVAAEEKYKELQEVFGEKTVALIHGKMKESEKEKVMESFAGKGSAASSFAIAEDNKSTKKISDQKNIVIIYDAENSIVEGGRSPQILVATTVIEVGIDVKEAAIIVIENAENFGLSQLHQLRGRVGRGEKQSYCILLYGKKYGTKGRERLSILKRSNDGFFIAEEDLKMRGSGELLGTKQSGVPEFKIADLALDTDLLKIAHKNAQVILHEDSQLNAPQSKKYRELLDLFGYDQCLKATSGG